MQWQISGDNQMKHHILSLGAGVQSSTLALMAAKGLITYKGEVVIPEFAIFADTQAEPKSVYDWLEYLKGELPFPVYSVTHGNLEEDAVKVVTSKKSGNRYLKTSLPVFTKGEKNGILRRQCTTDYKVRVLHSSARKLIGNSGKPWDGIEIIQWMGISVDEAHRMKDARVPFIENFYPLVEMGVSRQGCLEWMESNGYPRPPRSACVFCPYHSDAEWIRLKNEEPEEFERAVEFERRLVEAHKEQNVLTGAPYLHQSRKPLSEVELKANNRENHLGNECEGMCGV